MNRKFIYTLFLLNVVSALLWSCDKEQKINLDDFIGSGTESSGVYFPESFIQKALEKDATSFTVKIARTNGDEAQIVALRKLSGNEILEGIFTVPESVEFKAGETITEFDVLIDQDDAPKETFLNLEIGIDQDVLWNYGNVTVTLSLSFPADWKNLGTGYYNDNVIFDWELDDPDYLMPVTVWQRDDAPTYFRISDPYAMIKGDDLATEEFGFSIMQVGDVIEGPYYQSGPWSYQWPDVNITMPNLILTTQVMTYYDTYFEEPGYVQLPVQQFITGECWETFGQESSWVNNLVQSYQDNGLPAIIKLSPVIYYDPDEVTELGYFWYNYTGFDVIDTDYDESYPSDGDKIITLYFPGVKTE